METSKLFVAKDEDNGDGTFDRYTDSKSWNSSLTFADFGNYNLSLLEIIMFNLNLQGIQRELLQQQH